MYKTVQGKNEQLETCVHAYTYPVHTTYIFTQHVVLVLFSYIFYYYMWNAL